MCPVCDAFKRPVPVSIEVAERQVAIELAMRGGTSASGGTIQGMDKTTVYLPSHLKSAIKRVARRRGVSEAEVIRDSIRDAVGDDRPGPRGGLFASGAPIAREADDHLSGFGER